MLKPIDTINDEHVIVKTEIIRDGYSDILEVESLDGRIKRILLGDCNTEYAHNICSNYYNIQLDQAAEFVEQNRHHLDDSHIGSLAHIIKGNNSIISQSKKVSLRVGALATGITLLSGFILKKSDSIGYAAGIAAFAGIPNWIIATTLSDKNAKHLIELEYIDKYTFYIDNCEIFEELVPAVEDEKARADNRKPINTIGITDLDDPYVTTIKLKEIADATLEHYAITHGTYHSKVMRRAVPSLN